jgi:sulfite reductase alpha subunit-like flavoprotein
LRYFAIDELEREKLDEFVSIEGAVCRFTPIPVSFVEDVQDEMYDYCQRMKRTIWEVLSEFRSARIPREYVFDLFPPLRPREFSIASSIEVSSLHHFQAWFNQNFVSSIPVKFISVLL